MEVEKKQTLVDSLIEQLLPFIDRTKVSDTMVQNIVEEHLLMEQEQRKEEIVCLHDKSGTLNPLQGFFSVEIS